MQINLFFEEKKVVFKWLKELFKIRFNTWLTL